MVGQGTTDEFWDYVMRTVQDLSALSYYQLLGIDAGSPVEVVGEAYYALLRRLHPDAHGAERNRIRQRALTRLTARIGEAYRTLTDPKKRAEYDRGLPDGKRRLLQGEDASKPVGPQDPSSESARKLWEQGEAHLEAGELTRARAQLVLAKSFEPQSKAIGSAWDRLLSEEHAKLNEKRIARGFAVQPYQSNAPDPDPDPDDDEDLDDDDDRELTEAHDDDVAAARIAAHLADDLLHSGVAEPGDGDTLAGVRDDTIRRAVLDLRKSDTLRPDILRANAIVPEADAHIYVTPPETIPNIDQTLDDEIEVEVDTSTGNMADADEMFEPGDDDPDESTQQVALDDLVSPPLRVRVKTWEQAARLYELVRDCKGLYITSTKDAHIAQHVEVEVVLPTEDTVMIGAIVRDVVLPGDASGRKPGLGVEFTGIDDYNRAQIERLNPEHTQS